MVPVSEKLAMKDPGEAVRIAAQGILEKPDGGHRTIHDGGLLLGIQVDWLLRPQSLGLKRHRHLAGRVLH